MAKQIYKIAAPLSDNYLNMEIALQNKEGVGLKPLPVRVILAWMFSLLALVYVVGNGSSYIAEAGIPTQIAWSFTWVGFTWAMTQVDKSHQMRLEWLPALLIYLQKSNRTITTRRTSNAGPFYSLVGIKEINPDSGMVSYTDGSYAYWYAVVGTASVLLFPQDRDAILDRVDDFYKKIGHDCEIIFVTTKEAQKVHKQTAHLMAQYKALEFHTADIDDLVREQYNCLSKFVGKEFRSIHQYMIIKGDTKDALSEINSIVESEVQSSSLMLKQCVPLYQSDIEEVLAGIYSVEEVH